MSHVLIVILFVKQIMLILLKRTPVSQKQAIGEKSIWFFLYLDSRYFFIFGGALRKELPYERSHMFEPVSSI